MVYYCFTHINTNLVLLRLGLSEVHKTFITDRGRPSTDTPCVIPPGVLKSSQPTGDDPNLCMALNLAFFFVRYSYIEVNQSFNLLL